MTEKWLYKADSKYDTYYTINNSKRQLTASISSSSSSTVDTVTELNLPMFFVCFVTMTCSIEPALELTHQNKHCLVLPKKTNKQQKHFKPQVSSQPLQQLVCLITCKNARNWFDWTTISHVSALSRTNLHYTDSSILHILL